MAIGKIQTNDFWHTYQILTGLYSEIYLPFWSEASFQVLCCYLFVPKEIIS